MRRHFGKKFKIDIKQDSLQKKHYSSGDIGRSIHYTA